MHYVTASVPPHAGPYSGNAHGNIGRYSGNAHGDIGHYSGNAHGDVGPYSGNAHGDGCYPTLTRKEIVTLHLLGKKEIPS